MTKIIFNNKEFNIDDAATASITNELKSHLGTIPGNDLKLVIGGVEYGVDSSKLSGTIVELENALSGLPSDSDDTLVAGLYQTGTDTMIASWDNLVADGTIHVENGVVYTDFDPDECVNASSDALAGDLILPCDGTITKIGDAYWDDNINYNEEYDYYEGGYVGHFAFPYCVNLTGVMIPDSVTSICYEAFTDCESLSSIIIPDSVTSIDWCAFYNCTSLESIVIPGSVTTIGSSTFSGCESLSSIVIPDSVTSIGDNAFCDCASLKSVTIPDSVTSIEYYAFSRCTSLTNITFEGTVAQWNAITLGEGIWADTQVPGIQCSDGYVSFK
jgi:hypothetical protein